MLYPFKLRIYDQHEKEGGEEDGWLRFDYVFELNERRVTDFKEHVLFDNDGNPTKCVQIFFDNNEYVYGCYSLDKFLDIYNNEYKTTYAEWFANKQFWEGNIEEEKPVKKPWWKFWGSGRE